MIVITTPTGQIGRQVLDRILDSGEAARVIARDPSRLSARVRARAEVVQGSHGDAGAITKALAGADRLFWLVPPPGFRHTGSSDHYYLHFTQPACQAIASQGVRVAGISTLGHGYQGKAGLLSAARAMDKLIEGTGAAYPRPLRQSSESHGLPDRRSSHQCTAFPAALVPGTTRER